VASMKELARRSARTRIGAVLCALATGGACLAGGLLPLAQASAQEGSAQGAPALSATVEQCLTSDTAAANRSVTFTGQMETVPGAHRMAMQIVVQEHLPGEVGFHTLTAESLGTWQRSEVGVKIYKYVRQVTNLPSPAAFRALVEYRWLSEKGHIIRSDERRTSICRQPSDRSRTTVAPAPASGSGSTTPPATSTTPSAAATSLATMPRA
jgi:hypothetical protein